MIVLSSGNWQIQRFSGSTLHLQCRPRTQSLLSPSTSMTFWLTRVMMAMLRTT